MVKKVPDALVIVSVILLIFIGLTWIVPAGKFERTEINGRQAVVPGTFTYVEQQPQSPLTFFTAPIKGFIAAAEIIGFVLLIGGAFYVITATGAVTAGLQSLIRFSQNHPQLKNLIIPLLMVHWVAAHSACPKKCWYLSWLPFPWLLHLNTIPLLVLPFPL